MKKALTGARTPTPSRCTAGYHLPGRNINFIYADYYYIEAIRKLKGRDTFLW